MPKARTLFLVLFAVFAGVAVGLSAAQVARGVVDPLSLGPTLALVATAWSMPMLIGAAPEGQVCRACSHVWRPAASGPRFCPWCGLAPRVGPAV